MSGGVQGSKCHDVWSCVLLDMCEGLGSGEARMSTLSAGGPTLQGPAFERVVILLTPRYDSGSLLYSREPSNRCWSTTFG